MNETFISGHRDGAGEDSSLNSVVSVPGGLESIMKKFQSDEKEDTCKIRMVMSSAV